VAVTCGAHKRDFDQTIAVHPTLAEEFMLMRAPVRRVAHAVQPPAAASVAA
jgi:glutathione reductase (NADPH)